MLWSTSSASACTSPDPATAFGCQLGQIASGESAIAQDQQTILSFLGDFPQATKDKAGFWTVPADFAISEADFLKALAALELQDKAQDVVRNIILDIVEKKLAGELGTCVGTIARSLTDAANDDSSAIQANKEALEAIIRGRVVNWYHARKCSWRPSRILEGSRHEAQGSLEGVRRTSTVLLCGCQFCNKREGELEVDILEISVSYVASDLVPLGGYELHGNLLGSELDGSILWVLPPLMFRPNFLGRHSNRSPTGYDSGSGGWPDEPRKGHSSNVRCRRHGNGHWVGLSARIDRPSHHEPRVRVRYLDWRCID